MDDFNRGMTANQGLQMLCQLIRELASVLFLCILVVPHNGAALLLDGGSVNVIAIVCHDLLHSRHPLLVLDFKELFPALFLAGLQPVAALCSDPEVFLLHESVVKH